MKPRKRKFPFIMDARKHQTSTMNALLDNSEMLDSILKTMSRKRKPETNSAAFTEVFDKAFGNAVELRNNVHAFIALLPLPMQNQGDVYVFVNEATSLVEWFTEWRKRLVPAVGAENVLAFRREARSVDVPDIIDKHAYHFVDVLGLRLDGTSRETSDDSD